MVQKFKIVSLSWNLSPRLIQVCRIQWWCSLFLFQNGNTLFGQIWSNMQNSMVMFTFSVFDWKYPFRANLVQKINVVSLTWNFILRLIQVRRIQWWCSLLLFQSGNTLFGQIWYKKIEIVSLSWNLVPRLIQICRIQRWCSLFCLRLEIPFLVKCGPKNQNC